MKRELILGVAIFVVAVASACNSQDQNNLARKNETPRQTSGSPAAPVAQSPQQVDQHGHAAAASDVPAFQTDAASLKNLGPTLSPEKFLGRAKEAYEAVKGIPRTIAQLPCYCHCDKGFGHKSLHTCFEDDHAAHCAVCVDEALLAYRLEKEEKLGAAQIRERIIAQYSAEHAPH